MAGCQKGQLPIKACLPRDYMKNIWLTLDSWMKTNVSSIALSVSEVHVQRVNMVTFGDQTLNPIDKIYSLALTVYSPC